MVEKTRVIATFGDPAEDWDRGTAEAWARRVVVPLLCILAAASFWSTAVVQISGVILVLGLFFLRPMRKSLRILWESHPEKIALRRVAIVLWGIYEMSIILSLMASGTSIRSSAGLVWQPILFLVPLALHPENGESLTIGGWFVVSGALAAGTTLLMDLLGGFDTAPSAFTGLTTSSSMLLLAALSAFALSLRPGHGILVRWPMTALGFLCSASMFWTSERAPAAVLAAAGGILLVLVRPRFSLVWVALLCGLFLLAPSALREKSEWLLRGKPLDRYVVWDEGWRQLARVPLFGHGPDSYEHLLPSDARRRFLQRSPDSWHNDILQTVLDSGPIAAAALAGLLCLTLAAAGARLWKDQGTTGNRITMIPALLLASLAALGMVGSVVTTAVLGSVFWLLMGFSLDASNPMPAFSGRSGAALSRLHHGRKPMKGVFPAAAASLCLLIGCGTGQQYAALPEGLDRAAVPHVVIPVQALRYEFIPDTLRVQSGTLVTLKISSTAGTHGFSLRAFGIDERIDEGQTRSIEFYAARPGEFDFHCSHFCGMGHFWMTGKVIVQ